MRNVEPARLSIAEAAEYLGIKRSTLYARRAHSEFPPEDGRTGRTPWYYASTLDAYRAEHPARFRATKRAG